MKERINRASCFAIMSKKDCRASKYKGFQIPEFLKIINHIY